jgi:hypothetical protein
MRANQFRLGIGVLAALAFAVGIAPAADKKISKQDVPKQVMDSVNARFPGADVTGVEKETEDGNVVYDFELKHDGRKYESDVKEDGTIMEIEKEVAAKDAPPALAHTIKARYPDAAIKEIMEVNKVTGKQEKPIHYEVTISTGGKHKEVIVGLDGKTVREEAEERPADGK